MKNVCVILLFVFSLPAFPQGTWMQKSNYPGQVIMTGVGFTIAGKGYIGTGQDGASNNYSEFYQYDPVSDNWTVKANFAGPPRRFAAGFSIGANGYIGTGFNGSVYYNDFWEYNSLADSWTQKANVGGPPRATALAFSYNGRGYIGTGASVISGLMQDLWQYNPVTNVWVQKANFPGTARMDMERPFMIGSKLYCGTGLSSSYCNDFWEYDVPNDTWTQKANFAGSPRFGGTGFAICNYGYIGFGQTNTGTMNPDMWKYDPAANSWMQVASIPVGRIDAPVFVIGNKAYIGPGGSGNDFWEYTPDSCDTKPGFREFSEEIFISVYPNPVKEIVTVLSQIKKGEIIIYNHALEKIYSAKVTGTKTEIDLGKAPNGIYFIKVISDEGTATRKIIKE
ncbi:MAG: Kelch repeat type 1-containing protein [Bacteroidetes bacterium]|nr:MAG: Kelch repeat type 1-containing protein [Bacteroidota bacterium]